MRHNETVIDPIGGSCGDAKGTAIRVAFIQHQCSSVVHAGGIVLSADGSNDMPKRIFGECVFQKKKYISKCLQRLGSIQVVCKLHLIPVQKQISKTTENIKLPVWQKRCLFQG